MVTTKYNGFIYAARPRTKFDLRRKLRRMFPQRIFRLGLHCVWHRERAGVSMDCLK